MATIKVGKVKSIIFVMMLVISSLFVVANGAVVLAASSGNFDYQYINGDTEVQITGYHGPGGALTIPGSIDGKPVTSIGDSAFYSIASLTSVNIPDSVRSIGDYAFSSCTLLVSVTMPAGLVTIGNYSFSYCSSLSSIFIPGGVTSIGDYTFSYCSSLVSISIPANVSTFGNIPFFACTSLTSINVSAGNANFASLNGVLFNKDLSTLIAYPCGKTGSFIIPDSVIALWGWSFYDCIGLTSVTIPSSVIYLGNYAFNHCSALTAINVSAGNANFASLNGVLYNKAGTTLIQYPGGKAGSFIIPNTATNIGDYAFANCMFITSVTIPSSITSIGQNAFSSCDRLTSAVIPVGVLTIGYGAFNFCENLSSAAIPAGVTSIGSTAFYYCTSLTSVSIPASVTSIGDNAFYGCSEMSTIDVNIGNPNYASLNGVLYNKTLTTLIQCPGGKVGPVLVPNSVTKIVGSAFSECHLLTSVTIQGSISTLGDHMFSDCTSLSSITIPVSVTVIGNYTFYACTNLTSMTIPVNVVYIGSDAFANCYALPSINIPGSVKTIETYAFYDCTSLTGFDVNQANGNYASVNGVLYNKAISTLIQYPQGRAGDFIVPSSVTTIADSAFADSSVLNSVTVPASVLKIESSAFAFCVALERIEVSASNLNYASVDGVLYNKNGNNLIQFPSGKAGAFVIPNNVSSIGDVAFYWCNLTSVEIPSSVIAIGNWTFGNCKSLTEIHFDGNAPATGDHWLYSYNANLKIYYLGGASGFTTPTWFGVQTIAMFPVTGKVVGSDGNGLANITVALENGISVKTGANGDFTILASTGDHTLTVSGPGIETKNVNVKVTGSALAVGTISVGKSNDIMVLVLIMVLAIVIVLVVAFVMLRRRNRGKTNLHHFASGSTNSAPVAGPSPEVTSLPMICPECGAKTMGAPFCGNCGRKLD